jgi:hypothetical protein
MRDCLSTENHTREERAVYHRPSLHGARRIDVPFKKEKVHDQNQSTLSAMKQTKERPCTHRRTRFNDHPSASSSSLHNQSQRNWNQRSRHLDQENQRSLILYKTLKTKLKLDGLKQSTFHKKDPQNKLNCVSHLPDRWLQSFIRSQHFPFPVPRSQSHTLSLNRSAVNHQSSHLDDT